MSDSSDSGALRKKSSNPSIEEVKKLASRGSLYPREQKVLLSWVETLGTEAELLSLWEDFEPEIAAAAVVGAGVRAPITRRVAELVIKSRSAQAEHLACQGTLTPEARRWVQEWALESMREGAGRCADQAVNTLCAEARKALMYLGARYPEDLDELAKPLMSHLQSGVALAKKDAPEEDQLSHWSAETLMRWEIQPSLITEICERLGYRGSYVASFLLHPSAEPMECVRTLQHLKERGEQDEREIRLQVESAIEIFVDSFTDENQRIRPRKRGEVAEKDLPHLLAIQRLLLEIAPREGCQLLKLSSEVLAQDLTKEDLLPLLQSPDSDVRLTGIRLVAEIEGKKRLKEVETQGTQSRVI